MPRRNALQHCLHVFKFADRVNAMNLIQLRTRAGLSRSDSLYRPRFEVLSVKRFARVTTPDRTFCSRSGSDASATAIGADNAIACCTPHDTSQAPHDSTRASTPN
jgi:hypothetical protein